MLEKLQAVENRFDELCFKSEQPDFYADPKKAAKLLREKNDLEPIIEAFRAYKTAQQEMTDFTRTPLIPHPLHHIRAVQTVRIYPFFSQ